jgi:hypothetical protein
LSLINSHPSNQFGGVTAAGNGTSTPKSLKMNKNEKFSEICAPFDFDDYFEYSICDYIFIINFNL